MVSGPGLEDVAHKHGQSMRYSLLLVLTGVGLGRGVDVNENSGVRYAVDTRDLNGRRGGSSRSSNVDLEARHVESMQI